ncbi:MAG: DUF423 domain-containing protein [Planctomycetaceae bacterium]|nr:DUF423 domain-containing protein [Planctomycetaceae bacterium]
MSDSSSARCWIATGAALAGLAVVTGAFAAHLLDQFVVDKYADVPAKKIAGEQFAASWKYLQDFKTAAEYQMYHALGLLAVGLLSLKERRKSLQVAGWSFLIGILLFSGSLYVLVLTGITKLGAITPFGGVAFIIGWISLTLAALSISTFTTETDNATV